jgi:hypothetical protein
MIMQQKHQNTIKWKNYLKESISELKEKFRAWTLNHMITRSPEAHKFSFGVKKFSENDNSLVFISQLERT